MHYLDKLLGIIIYPRSGQHYTRLTTAPPDHHTPLWQNVLLEMSKQIFIHGQYYILQASPPHHHTPKNGNKIYPPQFANHGCFLFFLWYPMQNVERIRYSPGILPWFLTSLVYHVHPIGLWLRLPAVTTSFKAINHHLFRVKTDAKLATKHLVEVMWHDENNVNT
jgi:hypothetical protein